MRSMREILIATVALGGMFGASPLARAAVSGYTFTQINPPGLPSGFMVGINDLGQIVGTYVDSAGNSRGFLYTDGQFTTILPPGATDSSAVGINNRGQILGTLGFSSSFIYDDGIYTLTSAPPSFVGGINDLDQIAGSSVDGGFSYVDTRGSITPINVPGALGTAAMGINDRGDVVGSYFTSNTSFDTFGFLYTRGTYTNIQVPGTSFTIPGGINNRGQIAGVYCDVTFTICPGFVDTNGSFTTLSVPGSASYTQVIGINDLGQLVGFDSIGPNGFGIFLATPIHGSAMSSADPPAAPVPEPASGALVAAGLIGLGVIVRRKRD